MRRPALLLTAMIALSASLGVGLATPASAHPLGNFTVNRYARVEVSAGVVRVHYVLDEAEIPAFQERDAVTADRLGFATARAREIAAGLHVQLDGSPVSLGLVGPPDLSQPPGQGGLLTLRVAATFEVALPGGPADEHTLTLEDANEPDRIGWREILVTAPGDGRVLATDAPTRDQSDELRAYPADLTRSPLDARRARVRFTAGSLAVVPSPLTRAAAAPARSGGGFAGLLTGGLAVPLMLIVSLGFGALHALGPGHGKTVMAAYLAGTRGRASDAFALGAVVSLMHTASVLALGVVLYQVDRTVVADRVFPWFELVAGVTVVAVGLWLLAHRYRAWRQHQHGHAHSHDHAHEPTHRPLSRRGLVALGAAGGLFPSPSAVVVLLSAFAVHRVALGLGLIAAFSLGLAASLTGVGLALVYGRDLMARSRLRGATAWMPVAGASTIVIVGIAFVARGLSA